MKDLTFNIFFIKTKNYISNNLHYICMYVRKVKKAGKVYSYYYKSRRIGNKVKSIYVGKAEIKKIEKPFLENKNTKTIDVVKSLLEFDDLLNQINKLIHEKELNLALNLYNKIFETYKNLDIKAEDKKKIFNKLDNLYNELVNLSKENKINLIE